MDIISVETFPLFYRPPVPYGDANGIKSYRSSFLFRVTTKSGWMGWGEAQGWLPGLTALFRERIVPFLMGQPALERHRLTETVTAWDRKAAAGLSMALTEIAAKRGGLSVTDLWGGRRNGSVPVYASFQSYSQEADWRKRSLRIVEDALNTGFTAVKIKIGGKPLAEDERHVRAVLSLAEGAAQVALDANESYDTPSALEWRRCLQDVTRLMWLEEPLPCSRPDDLALLRGVLGVPIAGGENLVDPALFLPLLQRRAIDCLTPDPLHMGGIERFRETAALARHYNVRVSPHTFDGALSRLYALAAQSCIRPANKIADAPPEPVEWDAMDNAIAAVWPVQPEKGHVRLPEGPGLGVEPDMERLKSLLWDGGGYV